LLQVDSVAFAYRRGDPVVRDVSFTVAAGSIVGLLGPNGSGKTTLLRIVSGVLTPDRGSVRIGGTHVGALRPRTRAQRIAVVPQETHASFDYAALDIVLMGRYPHLGAFELEGVDDHAAASAAMAATGTAHLAARPFSTLSGGEKQRVVIASAVAQGAGLLLLDEPTASLDVGYQLEIAALLTRLNRERGTTMMVSTHDLNFAAALCSSLVLLRGGRVIAQGETERVLTREHVRALYDVDAEVARHPRAGHLMVVPIARC